MGTVYKTVGTVKTYGSCNFCNRGKQKESGEGLTFPYEKVIAVHSKKNGSQFVRFCEKCFNELRNL